MADPHRLPSSSGLLTPRVVQITPAMANVPDPPAVTIIPMPTELPGPTKLPDPPRPPIYQIPCQYINERFRPREYPEPWYQAAEANAPRAAATARAVAEMNKRVNQRTNLLIDSADPLTNPQ